MRFKPRLTMLRVCCGADNHIGSIRAGNDADLLVVDGNPLDDIGAVERISIVFFKGEQLDRSDLFNQE